MTLRALGVVAATLALTIGTTALRAQMRSGPADPLPYPLAGGTVGDSQTVPSPPSTLTGEWGGLRTRFRDAGVDLTLGLTSEFAANVAGGQRRDAADTDQLVFGAAIDTEKLFGLKGGAIQATITYRRGSDLGRLAGLGVLQQVQEVYGRGQTWRLTELWYEQDLGGGVDIKAGRLPQGSEFGSFSCAFENLSFCGAPAGNLAGDYWYNWPIAQWGGRLRLRRPDWYVMAGAYENNPRNLANKFILGYFRGATGVLVPAEVGYLSHLGPARLPGVCRVGGWYNTSNGNDVLLGTDYRPAAVTGLDPLARSGRYGGFVHLQQQITGSAKDDTATAFKTSKGLTVFLNVTQTDRLTSHTDNQLAAGLFFAGALPGRADDDIGVAVARTNVNGRAALAQLLATPGSEKPKAEYAAELFYSLALQPWLVVRPNVQYVVDPGGYTSARDVVVLGIKSAVTF